MSIIKTLLRTLATRSAVSQSPKNLQVPGMDIMLGRETSCGLDGKRLNASEGQGFVLPQNMRDGFANAQFEWAEYQVNVCTIFIFTIWTVFWKS